MPKVQSLQFQYTLHLGLRQRLYSGTPGREKISVAEQVPTSPGDNRILAILILMVTILLYSFAYSAGWAFGQNITILGTCAIFIIIAVVALLTFIYTRLSWMVILYEIDVLRSEERQHEIRLRQLRIMGEVTGLAGNVSHH